MFARRLLLQEPARRLFSMADFVPRDHLLQKAYTKLSNLAYRENCRGPIRVDQSVRCPVHFGPKYPVSLLHVTLANWQGFGLEFHLRSSPS